MDATLPNEMNALRELVTTLQTTLAAVQAEHKLLRQNLMRWRAASSESAAKH